MSRRVWRCRESSWKTGFSRKPKIRIAERNSDVKGGVNSTSFLAPLASPLLPPPPPFSPPSRPLKEDRIKARTVEIVVQRDGCAIGEHVRVERLLARLGEWGLLELCVLVEELVADEDKDPCRHETPEEGDDREVELDTRARRVERGDDGAGGGKQRNECAIGRSVSPTAARLGAPATRRSP